MKIGETVGQEVRAVVEVKAAIQRNAFELVADLVLGTTAKAELTLSAVAAARTDEAYDARHRSHDAVLAIQSFRTTLRALIRVDGCRADRIQVARNRSADDRSRRSGHDVTDSLRSRLKFEVSPRCLVGLDCDPVCGRGVEAVSCSRNRVCIGREVEDGVEAIRSRCN